jgi:hypothetical protein
MFINLKMLRKKAESFSEEAKAKAEGREIFWYYEE